MAEDDLTVDLVKKGEIPIHVGLVRSMRGLTVNIRVLPPVEEFFRNAGSGETVDVKVMGRMWQSFPKDATPLRIYSSDAPLPNINLDDGGVCTFNRFGTPIVESIATVGGGRSKQTNLGFLRLVGISEPDGISFLVKGVHTTEALREMKDRIGEGTRRFYHSYLKTVKMDVMVCTQELTL